MAKIPQYTKNAIKRYNAKFDRLAVNLPKGTKERIKALTGKSGNAYITALVLDDLDRLEGIKDNDPGPEEVKPDEWDLKMIADAKKENDGETVSFSELLERDGLTYADIQD